MRAPALVLLLLLAACGGDDGGVTPETDAASPDAGLLSYDPSNLTADDFIAGTGELSVGSGATIVLNTDTLNVEMHMMGIGAPRVQDQGADGEIAVFRYSSIQVDGTLEIVGSRAVALLATSNASIAGTILFPEGAALSCGLVTTGVVPGGGGGGHGTAGGLGGNAGGAPGAVRGNDTLVPLIPGCAGGPGIGAGTSEGGFGGGAIQISVGGALSLSGTVCASGGGGESVAGTGGGGGGSGGSILLEARDIFIDTGAGVFAHGGGGGGGGATNVAGEPGATSCVDEPASGGSAGGALGGAGGSGASGGGTGVNGGDGVNPTADAGGGAGGGVGRIRLNNPDGVTETSRGDFSGLVTQGMIE